jgi:site-specific recombinase XerD
MATVKVVLNRDREKHNREYSLVIQIINKKQKRLIYTPYRLMEQQYNTDKQKAVYCSRCGTTIKKTKEINLYINKVKRELQTLIKDSFSGRDGFTADDIVRKYKMQQTNSYLLTFLESLIQAKKRTSPNTGAAKPFISLRNSMLDFRPQCVLKFKDMTSALVKEYETYLYAKPSKKNTVCFYLRNMRTVYNMAADQSIEVCEQYPFKKVNLNTETTIKRSLKSDVIKRIATFECPNQNIEFARDIFMISFYARGMSFIDIAFLTAKNMEYDTIYYNRSKTKKLLKLSISKDLGKMISKYQSDSTYIFGLIDSKSDKPVYEQYQASYNLIYDNLRRLGKLMGLTTPLTLHVARHSWASIAKEIGIPTGCISEGLGHTSEKTTKIYLRELEQTVLDLVNEQILQVIRD